MRERLGDIGKKRMVIGIAITAFVIIIAAAALLIKKEESYYTIAVEEVNGTAVVSGEKNPKCNAYEGMHLYAGDDIAVMPLSDMTLLLDMGKYVYAEENAHFWIESETEKEKSRMRIHLEEGTELNRICEKLTEGEFYEVETPNAVMSVRGTIFKVSVWTDEKGVTWTEVSVYQGSVHTELKRADKEYRLLEAGDYALICGEDSSSVFFETGKQEEAEYEELSEKLTQKLLSYMEDGEKLCIGSELLKDYTKISEHKPREVIRKEADCQEKGEWALQCSVCGKLLESREIPIRAHEASGWQISTAATCTQDGEEQRTCQMCGIVLEKRTLEATGHNIGRREVLRIADCVTPGEEALYCTDCGILIETQEIPMLPHEEIVTWEKESTCTAEGGRVISCQRCKAVLEQTASAPLGHSYGSWKQTRAAGCTTEGERIRTCERCGKIERQSVASLGHDYGSWKTVREADCENEGERRKKCERCGSSTTEKTGALGHQYNDWKILKPADCETEGEEQGICSRCKKTFFRTLPAKGHIFGEWKILSESCEKDGERSRVCAVCQKEEKESVKAAGHSFAAWEVTKEAGCASEGTKTRICTVCKKEETENIEATGKHVFDKDSKHELSEDKISARVFCKGCSKEMEIHVVEDGKCECGYTF